MKSFIKEFELLFLEFFVSKYFFDKSLKIMFKEDFENNSQGVFDIQYFIVEFFYGWIQKQVIHLTSGSKGQVADIR